MDAFLEFIAIFVFGLIQGLTEVLPISSSGHLSLANIILPLPNVNLTIAAVLHVGSLAAIVWWLRRDLRLLWQRLSSSLTMILKRPRKREKASNRLTAYQKMPFLILLSFLPTMIIGLLLKPLADALFENKLLPFVFLIVNGLLLLITARQSYEAKTPDELDWKDYIFIGTMQGIAVIPGISRLGITLCASLWRGLGWYESVRLSFILSIPAILGGVTIQLFELGNAPTDVFTSPELILGVLVSLIASLLGIKVLSRTWLEKKSLLPFGYYCCMLGTFSFVYLAFGY